MMDALKRLGVAITAPIWVPGMIFCAVALYVVYLVAWPIYWIVTGKDDFETRMSIL